MRPPSVDRLARSLIDTGLPHPLLVDAARAAIAAGDPDSARALATDLRRALLQPVVNATGVLLHTNLGRAPLGWQQPAGYTNLELDLDTGTRGSRHAHCGRLLARLCGAEAAIVVNNNAAAVLLVVAALAAGRQVVVSRGESVEIGGGFRVPEVLEQSGARLVDVGTTNRTRIADYERAVRAPGADVALVLKVHPSNYRVEGFTESVPIERLAGLGPPVLADIGSGLLDAACPWLADGPPPWLGDEPAARQTLAAGAALVSFSGDKLLGGPQAGIIAGRADLVAACAAHPLARALRPGGLLLAALQDVALAYLRRDGQAIAFWRMASVPVVELRRRAAALGTGEVVGTEALPGAGSLPGTTIPSAGIALGGDHLAALRALDRPVIARVHEGRTLVDLRTVDPTDDAYLARVLGDVAGDPGRRAEVHVVATAGHVDHGKSSLVLALTGTDPDRFEEEKRRGLTIDLGFAHTTLPSGRGVSFVDVPGHVRFIKNMLAGVGAVDACLFVVAATEGWKPQSEEHLRILEQLGVTHGLVALTKVDLVDAEELEIARFDLDQQVAGSFLASAEVVEVAAPSGLGIDELREALDRLLAATPTALDRGRARLWVDRVFAAKGAGTVVTGTLAGGRLSVGDRVVVGPLARAARVRAIQSQGRACDDIGPGNRVALNLNGVDHDQVERGDAVVEPGRWRPTRRFDASLDVLAAVGHEVSRRGAYVAYLGSGEFPARLRVLGSAAIPAGARGLVRLHLATPLPLLPGDRFVLRESGRAETVGGGEVLDVAPVLPASKARPDRSVERVVAERRWIEADELELVTGERVDPTLGRWVVAPGRAEELVASLHERIASAGGLGLDVAALDERERAALPLVAGVVVADGWAKPADQADPLADHPYLAALVAGGATPPPPDGVDRAELRALVKRGLVVEREGVWFATVAVEAAARVAARLLAADPDGFTVAQLRDAVGATRKFALPLANELDARGVTRRRGDLRIAGPRLPAP